MFGLLVDIELSGSIAQLKTLTVPFFDEPPYSSSLSSLLKTNDYTIDECELFKSRLSIASPSNLNYSQSEVYGLVVELDEARIAIPSRFICFSYPLLKEDMIISRLVDSVLIKY